VKKRRKLFKKFFLFRKIGFTGMIKQIRKTSWMVDPLNPETKASFSCLYVSASESVIEKTNGRPSIFIFITRQFSILL